MNVDVDVVIACNCLNAAASDHNVFAIRKVGHWNPPSCNDLLEERAQMREAIQFAGCVALWWH